MLWEPESRAGPPQVLGSGQAARIWFEQGGWVRLGGFRPLRGAPPLPLYGVGLEPHFQDFRVVDQLPLIGFLFYKVRCVAIVVCYPMM